MKRLLFIPLLFISFILSAAPIGEKRARELAVQFFAKTTTRAADVKLDLEWAGYDINQATTRGAVIDADEALLYIYNRADSEGFVIISGDDSQRPIVAYSNDGYFEVNDIADATRWMLSAWCEQIEAARDANIPPLNGDIIIDDGGGEELDELLYETAKWNQGEPYNRLAPVYQAGRAPSGCVATAISIVMRWHKWPDCGVGTVPAYECKYNDDDGNLIEKKFIPANELGHTYDWNKMPLKYESGKYTNVQGDEVARLMYDVGTAMSMGYAPGGSGAVTGWMPDRISKYFKYGKGAMWLTNGSYTNEEWFAMLRENMQIYGPMVGAGGGHAYVVDGYDKQGLFHLNYGWGGSADGYYYLPDNDFTRGMGACFYLETDKDGTSKYRDNIAFVTYGWNTAEGWLAGWRGIESADREFKTGVPINLHIHEKGMHNASPGEFNGEVALVMCDKDGNFKEVVESYQLYNFASGAVLRRNDKVTVRSEIKEGYRLRYYFKGENPGEWQHVREGGSAIELVLCAGPEEIAENVQFSYDRSSKTFTFYSDMAVKCEIKNSEGQVVGRGTMGGVIYQNEGTTIDMSKQESGEYTVEFSFGGDPYVIQVVL